MFYLSMCIVVFHVQSATGGEFRLAATHLWIHGTEFFVTSYNKRKIIQFVKIIHNQDEKQGTVSNSISTLYLSLVSTTMRMRGMFVGKPFLGTIEVLHNAHLSNCSNTEIN